MDTDVIYCIAAVFRSADVDNYPTADTQIDDEHGFFTDRAAAEAHVDSYNQSSRQQYEAYRDKDAAKNEERLNEYRVAVRQNEVLRANNLPTIQLPAEPKPRAPMSYDNFVRIQNVTTYEVVAIARSTEDSKTAAAI